MDRLLVSAASGMKTRMESLDMLANNIANTGTSGFKADREFYNLAHQELPLIQRQWTDFQQGALLVDGNPLHMALEGQGFFAVTSPNGIVYTRSGEFQVNSQNQLATQQGYTLRNVRDNGQPIAVDPLRPIDVDASGVVSQNGLQVGQIEISRINDPTSQLRKQGGSNFLLSASGGATPDGETHIRQGALEQSNAPVNDGAVRLVSVMRQFEMLQRALAVGAEMNKQAIDQVARVG